MADKYIPSPEDYTARIHVSKVQRVGGPSDGLAALKFEITGLKEGDCLIMPTENVPIFLSQIRTCLAEALKHNSSDT